MSEDTETKVPRRSRIHPSSVIRMGKDQEGKHYGPDHNPRRPGTDCGARFVNYKDGMTVNEARLAGMTAADVRSDSDEGFIVIEHYVEPEAEVTTDSAEKPKRGGRKSKKADEAQAEAA